MGQTGSNGKQKSVVKTATTKIKRKQQSQNKLRGDYKKNNAENQIKINQMAIITILKHKKSHTEYR